jgi:ubiquinone/menaquinone biosynthesis C-methylase UbiE
MKEQRVYLQAGKNAEVQRLSIQAAVWEKEAYLMLDEIGVQAGWHCVDLGCGPVGILEPLSKKVGLKGRVVGIESDPIHLMAVTKMIQDKELSNVEVVFQDAYKNLLTCHSFDLTHARFVFALAGQDAQLFENMINLTRPGGVVAFQESDLSSWNCLPFHPAWEKIKKAVIAIFELNGSGNNAIQRHLSLFKEANIQDLHTHTAKIDLPKGHAYRMGMNQLAWVLRDSILENGIIKADEFDHALQQCDVLMNDPNVLVTSYTLVQIWGHVPSKNQ